MILGTDCVEAQSILKPPFGIRWGDSPEKLVHWASKQSLDVVITLPGEQPEIKILRIQNKKGILPDTQATSIESRFISGRLFELSIHYSDLKNQSEDMEPRFNLLKKQIESEWGALSINRQERNKEDGYTNRTISYHREHTKGLFIVLVLTEIEDDLRKRKESRFSLIYRNENLKDSVN